MEPKPILYGIMFSPPVRSVLLVAKALNIELEFKEINLLAGEHLKPEYLKMNPRHTVPTIDDNGFYLWDSHAILTYLVGKYGKDDSLYPKDLKKRAIIDQRLHFESSTFFPRMIAITRPMFTQNQKTIPDDKIADANEAYNFLEKFLEQNEWVAGDNMSVADLSLFTTCTSLSGLVPLSENDHKHIIEWIKKMKQVPGFDEINQEGLTMAAEFLKSKYGI